MVIYTVNKAKRRLDTLLNQAWKKGKIGIKSKDGKTFILTPEKNAHSPLSVKGIKLGISTKEIVKIIRNSRMRTTTKSE
jgi:hypothetical protein